MKTFSSIKEMSAYSKKIKDRGQSLGLVPTMGSLHDGHLSLIQTAKNNCDVVVVSIFVNRLQFGPSEDFKKYPRNSGLDKKKLEAFEPIVLFSPKDKEFTPENISSTIEINGLSKKLCGKSRPAHFRGVATIVSKLFNIVQPNYAFFGLKDYQQQVIIKKLVDDLNYDIKIVTIDTSREFDGLAQSSRNNYLNARERKAAPILYKSLLRAKEAVEDGERDTRRIHYLIAQHLGREPLVKIEYIAICDPNSLEEVKAIKGPVLIALAANIGSTRLIDNVVAYPK